MIIFKAARQGRKKGLVTMKDWTQRFPEGEYPPDKPLNCGYEPSYEELLVTDPDYADELHEVFLTDPEYVNGLITKYKTRNNNTPSNNKTRTNSYIDEVLPW